MRNSLQSNSNDMFIIRGIRNEYLIFLILSLSQQPTSVLFKILSLNVSFYCGIPKVGSYFKIHYFPSAETCGKASFYWWPTYQDL